MTKQGVLLINLGTPDDPSPRSVYRYLREFLNDPRVVNLPSCIRSILINGIIIPLRYKKSSLAYQKIWQTSGSPLLTNSEQLTTAIADKLGSHYQVTLGMRYGKPSIASALAKLKDCQHITIIPLFPQYASAATGSALENVLTTLAKEQNIPGLSIINDFYAYPGFITALAANIKTTLADKPVDKVIFSYHGLPERHITQSRCTANCDHVNACPRIDNTNTYCYRAQCYHTSELLANALTLTNDQYSVAFQSRLGRTPWIKPYIDLLLPNLRQQGVANIAVACPSFVVDCLETLEEINIRLREQWKNLGGNEFIFIPSLNTHHTWVNALSELVINTTTKN